MEKKALGVMILLVMLSIFTGHWMVAVLLPLFEYFARKYMYPEIKRIVSDGLSKESLLKTLNNEDTAIFGLLLALVLYIMMLKEILTALVINFGVWSFIMAMLYIVVPILGILGRSRKK